MSGYNYMKMQETNNSVTNLEVVLLSENAKAPTRSYALDAGLDLYAAED